MAQTTSSAHSTAHFTEVLGRGALLAAQPSPIASQFFNRYNIAGRRSKSLRLNQYTDIGPATTGTEGTTFSTLTTLGYETGVTLTPTEAAMMLAQVTDDTIELTDGIESMWHLMKYGSLSQQLMTLKDHAGRLVASCFEKLETDCVATFANASTSVGTTTVDMSIGVHEEAIYNLEIAELPANSPIVSVYHKRQISDIRRELEVTSGGATGTIHVNKNVDHLVNANGYAFPILGVPIFGYDKSAELTANSGADVVGATFRPGNGAPELGEGGSPGAYAICHGRGLQIRMNDVLRDRATDIMAEMKYAVGERRDSWTVKVVTDA